MKPMQGVHTRDPDKHVREPADLLRDGPPPDGKSGLTPEQAGELVGANMSNELRATHQLPMGVINHPIDPATAGDKCGARQGRCFGLVRWTMVENQRVGTCSRCGQAY